MAWSAASLYPLAAGNAWSYVADTGEDRVLTTVSVQAVRQGVAVVRSGAQQLRYRLEADGVMRLGKPGYLLKDPVRVGAEWQAGPGVWAKVRARVDGVQTPAGVFSNCAEVAELDSRTGRNVVTTYCPGIGPVRVLSQVELSRGPVEVRALLQGYATGDRKPEHVTPE